MRARDIIGLVIALLFALGIAMLSRMLLTEDESPQKAETTTIVEKAKTIDILVATTSLSVGHKITRTDLRWQPWPEASLNANYLTKGETKINDLEGSVVRYPLSQGEPMALDDIIRPGDRSVLSAIIDSGRRGLSINVNAATSSSGLVKPGDYVDVILSKSEASTDGLSNVISSEVVVANVRVLAIDARMGAEPGTIGGKVAAKTIPKTATLELTPNQADALVKATQQGELFLSLHSLSAGEEEDQCPGGVCEKELSSDFIIKVIRGNDSKDIKMNAGDEPGTGDKK